MNHRASGWKWAALAVMGATCEHVDCVCDGTGSWGADPSRPGKAALPGAAVRAALRIAGAALVVTAWACANPVRGASTGEDAGADGALDGSCPIDEPQQGARCSFPAGPSCRYGSCAVGYDVFDCNGGVWSETIEDTFGQCSGE